MKAPATILALTLLFLGASTPLPARPGPDAAPTPVKIERVALFKNGLGHFSASAKLPDKGLSVRFGRLPIPTLGTFWVEYSADAPIRGVFAGMEETVEHAPVPSLARLLAANVGRRVVLNAAKDSPGIEGVVLSAGAAETRPETPPSRYVMAGRPPDGSRCADPYGGGALVVLRTERGLVTLNIGAVGRIDFPDGDAVLTAPSTHSSPTLRLELEREAPGKTVGVSYLARGITWAPSYRVDLSDPAKARLSASAVIVNEVADLDDVTLDLVTGFPNVQFADVACPLDLSQPLADFLNTLRTGRVEVSGRRGHLLTQQAVLQNVASFDESPGFAPTYSADAPGQAAEDLFLYPLTHFSLKRGETAYIPLFTAEAPYRHVYLWKVADFLDSDERYRRQEQERNGTPAAEEVWHVCRLTNPLKMPLTTAPAEFLKDGRFVGQDTCYFTAPGAETTIRVNRAMNVLAEEAEYEVERKRGAGVFYGNSYDLVTLKGELKLRNRMDKAAVVEVTKELSGEVRESLPAAKDIPQVKSLLRVNTRRTLAWKLELQPGEEKTLSYTFAVYIRD